LKTGFGNDFKTPALIYLSSHKMRRSAIWSLAPTTTHDHDGRHDIIITSEFESLHVGRTLVLPSLTDTSTAALLYTWQSVLMNFLHHKCGLGHRMSRITSQVSDYDFGRQLSLYFWHPITVCRSSHGSSHLLFSFSHKL
jgi:hypothetical protein